jgi:hemerythrin
MGRGREGSGSMIKLDSKSEVIQWDLNYSVGITEIDLQHRMMILMLNELHNSFLRGKTLAESSKIFEGMFSYIREHIATEERLFDNYAYPFAATHKEEHRTILRFLESLGYELKTNRTRFDNQPIFALSDWLKNHFISKDRTYSYFFIRKGLN